MLRLQLQSTQRRGFLTQLAVTPRRSTITRSYANIVSLSSGCYFVPVISARNMGRQLALAVVILVYIPQNVFNHVISPGKCPKMDVKKDFDIKKYMGTWYGHASFGTESTQGRGKCVTARYEYNATAKHVDVYNWQIPSPGYRGSISGFAVPIDPTFKEGKLRVTFQVSANRTKTFPLMVLDTDYERWAVVYFCRDLEHHHETSGWILTRVQDLDNSIHKSSVDAEVGKVLRKAKLDRSAYNKTVQNECDLN